MNNLEVADEMATKAKEKKPRTKKVEKANDNLKFLQKALAPKHRIKLCCHRPGIPEICEIVEIPFQPRDGDVLCIHPPKAEDPDAKLTIPLHGLIFDVDMNCWVLRPDIIHHMSEQFKKEKELDRSNPVGDDML